MYMVNRRLKVHPVQKFDISTLGFKRGPEAGVLAGASQASLSGLGSGCRLNPAREKGISGRGGTVPDRAMQCIRLRVRP
jgi:hypothetical protein